MNVKEIIKSFDSLSTDEQDSLLETLFQHRAKAKEVEILASFKELKTAIATGQAKKGTVEDLITDLSDN